MIPSCLRKQRNCLRVIIALTLLLIMTVPSNASSSQDQINLIKELLGNMGFTEPSIDLIRDDDRLKAEVKASKPKELSPGGVQTSVYIKIFASEALASSDFESYYDRLIAGSRLINKGEPLQVAGNLKAVITTTIPNSYDIKFIQPNLPAYPTGEAHGGFACGNISISVVEARAAEKPDNEMNSRDVYPTMEILANKAKMPVQKLLMEMADKLQERNACTSQPSISQPQQSTNPSSVAAPPAQSQQSTNPSGRKPRFTQEQKDKFTESAEILFDYTRLFYIVGLNITLKNNGTEMNDKFSSAVLILCIKLVEMSNDPPDPNFMVVAQPAVPLIPPVTAQGKMTQKLADAWNALLTNQAQAIGNADALLHSIERAQGAFDAGDANWQAKQMDAAARHASQMAALLNAEPALRANVKSSWQAAGLPDIKVTTDDVRKMQVDVAANGLTPEFINELTRLGADSTAIENIRKKLITQDPIVVAGSFPEILADPALNAATQGVVQALNEFAAGQTPSEPASIDRMTLQAGKRRVAAGDLVYLPVWLIKGADVANMDFTVSYDASVVVPENKLIKGNLLDNALFESNIGETGIILSAFAQKSGVSGTGTVAQIPFRAVGKPGTQTALHLEVTTINNPTGTSLAIDRMDGSIQILRPGEESQGDCDGDTKLTTVDSLCALQMSVKLITERLSLDMNADTKVTSRDSVLILQRRLVDIIR